VAAEQLEQKRRERGDKLDFYLCEADHVSECFDKTVTSSACGGNATILLYESGGWAFTSGLAKLLHNKLKGRQLTLPKPTHVALGSDDRYFIRFADGKTEWVGCEEMSKELQSCSSSVASVAYGGDWNSFFLVYANGGYYGYNVPIGLTDVIDKARRGQTDLECVSLGPCGEWYVRVRNGRAWWGGITTKTLKHMGKYNDKIKFIDFCDDGCYLFRYT